MQSLLDIFSIFQINFNQKRGIILVVLISILILFVLVIRINILGHNNKFIWNNSEDISDYSVKRILIKDSKNLKYKHPVKVMKVSSDLYLIDLDDRNFCGIGGCVYSLYSSDGELFLRFVHSHLPKNSESEFVGVIKNDNKYPCLVLSQADWVEPIVVRSKYCYSNHKYQFVNETFSNFQS